MSNIPNGYKQTEVGVIPGDWEVKPLGDFSDINSGGTPNRKVKLYWQGNIPWITTSQIDFNIVDCANEFITEEGLNNSAAKVYKAGTLLMAMYGQGKTRGKIAILGIDATTNQACAAIAINKENTKEYVFYNLSSRYDEIRSLSNTGNQENLNGELIKKILIALPPTKAEQTAIATALSDTDALISSLEKLIAKKRNIKQGAMQTLLQPKEGWEINKLGDIANVIMGQSPLSEYYNHKGIGLPLVQGNADIENRKTIIRAYTSAITKKGKNGDVIMSVRAPVGEISKATFDCCLGRGVCAISYKNEFMYHYLIYFEKSWAKLSTGSTFDSVNSKQVKELEIPIPKMEEEQTQIATILSDMDAEIAALETKLTKLKNIKLGMMQNLLTGKIRLL